MSQPRLSQLSIWNNHEKRVIESLILGLILLQQKASLGLSQANEEALNSELYFCLIEANRLLYIQNKGFDHPPTAEGRNPPDADDTPDSPRKKKIPDFYWGYIDHLEPDPRRSARNFYIECKRLGKPLQKDKILTTLYVQNGIRRFVTEEHAYAKGERSSAMVGYVQNMIFDAILGEVNTAARNNAEVVTLLNLIDDWQEQGVSKLDHVLHRPFPISPFCLHHFWVDLRSQNED
jgi:hypothetical protein